MSETPQQYTARILSYQQGKKPLSILAATPARLKKLLKNVPVARLKKRPEPDKWSAAEILAHLADSELVYGMRLRLVLSQNGVPIQATDQDAWAGCFKYGKANPRESLAIFTLLRAWNLRALKQAPKELWNNVGIHSERGEENVTRMAEMFAGHDVNHVKQLEAIVKKR